MMGAYRREEYNSSQKILAVLFLPVFAFLFLLGVLKDSIWYLAHAFRTYWIHLKGSPRRRWHNTLVFPWMTLNNLRHATPAERLVERTQTGSR